MLTRPLTGILLVLSTAACDADRPCWMRVQREVAWDHAPSDLGFSADDVAEQMPMRLAYTSTVRGDLPESWSSLEGDWELTLEVDRSREPLFERTDGQRCRTAHGTGYGDGGRRLSVPITLEGRVGAGALEFRGPARLGVSGLGAEGEVPWAGFLAPSLPTWQGLSADQVQEAREGYLSNYDRPMPSPLRAWVDSDLDQPMVGVLAADAGTVFEGDVVLHLIDPVADR